MCRRMVEAPCAAERSDGESLDNVREIIKKTKYFGLSFTIFVKKLRYFNTDKTTLRVIGRLGGRGRDRPIGSGAQTVD